MVTQCGRRLACSAPLATEKLVHVECCPTFYHVIDCPSELVSQDRQRLALAVLFLSAGEIFLARRLVAEESNRRFGESPREVGMAALVA